MSGKPEAYRLGLIGYPLGHSFSPRLHQAALDAYGLRGEYRLYAIAPGEAGLEEITELLEKLKTGVLHGLNVTIPHKQTVLPLVAVLTSVASAVGAVNTLYVRDGALTGDNTDVPGFLHDLERLVGSLKGTALVLGAGGSARAVVYGLLSTGWKVYIAARRIEQAEAICAVMSSAFHGKADIQAIDMSHSALAGQRVDLLVNTTPAGMYPNVSGCPWPEDLKLPEGAAVYDLVYNPLETRLVQRGRAAGLRAANGAGMLSAQAALAFQRWTGREAPYEIMEQAFEGPQRVDAG